MRKLILLFVFFLFVGSIAEAQVNKTVICKAGTLKSLLTSGDLITVTNLTVTGTMNAMDFLQLTGFYSLQVLDLSNVEIVATTGTTVYPANTIPGKAFLGMYKLNTILLPQTLTTISKNAFLYLSYLKSIVIPPSVITIGETAFQGCKSLTEVSIPASVTSIETLAFDKTSAYITVDENNMNYSSSDGVLFNKPKTELIKSPSSLTGTYIIPSTVTTLDKNAFLNCKLLTSVSIPTSVTTMGDSIFSGCSKIISMEVPSSVTTMGIATFQGCTSLSTLKLDASVTTIGRESFKFTALQTLDIPSTVTAIGASSFWGCKNLTTVNLPPALKSLGGLIFADCSNLTSINLPSTLTTIGNGAFNGCGIKTIIIPPSVTSIGKETFAVSGLTSITIPSSVTSIGEQAFYSSKIISLDLPSSVTSIGNRAFADCLSLTSINLSSSLKTIGSEAFVDCSSLKAITIPASVTSIGDQAFYYCTYLASVEFIDSPSLLTSIGYRAFAACKYSSIKIPSSVNTIGTEAFAYCNNLKTVTLPASLTSTSDVIFRNSNSVSTVYSFLTTPFNPSGLAKSTCKVYVPTDSKTTYVNDSKWTGFINIIEMSLTLSANTLLLPGTGGTVTSTVTSTNDWNYSSDSGWLTANKENGTISLSALANPVNAARTATVKISAPGVTDQFITITQEAGTTAINAVDASGLSVYPNPVQSDLYLNGSDQYDQLSVFDLNGKRVIHQPVNGNIVNVSKLANGIYTICLKGNKGVITSKFVKH